MISLLESEPSLFKLTTGPDFALLTFQVLPKTADQIENETNKLIKDEVEAETAEVGHNGAASIQHVPEEDGNVNAEEIMESDKSKYLSLTNSLTKKVHDRIGVEGKYWVTHTRVGALDVIRFVSGSEWTEDRHVEGFFHELVRISHEERDAIF